ncbi:MAG: hypothetical protein LBF67_01100 [Prevotellaceae bacterium]|nr:hypothetical protein [Prevotellaceae bacterium]
MNADLQIVYPDTLAMAVMQMPSPACVRGGMLVEMEDFCKKNFINSEHPIPAGCKPLPAIRLRKLS